MVNRYLQDLSDVVNYVHPDVKDLDCGILYEVLYIILDNEPQNAESICNRYSIKKSATKDEDEAIIDKFINKINRAMANQISIFNPDKREIFWIVVVACLLVGSIGCIRFIQRRKNKETKGNGRNVQQPVAVSLQPFAPPRQSLTVTLCLVVSAYVVNKLK
ncbi:hypothetical protein [Nostoc sp.]|uniref:hypothetical protein n=1 Tax=Nostoc sp. TaxID=1180 RepID=UPI002FF6F516